MDFLANNVTHGLVGDRDRTEYRQYISQKSNLYINYLIFFSTCKSLE
jgi:hypothetical protein